MAESDKAKPQYQELSKEIPIDAQCKGVLDKIATDLKVLQPTPRLGQIVCWINRYANTAPRPGMPAELEYRPAIVTRRLSPGRVDLQIFGELAMPMAQGAQYIGHPSQLKAMGNQLGPGGAWFYREILDEPGWSVPAEEFKVHRAALKERERKALADNTNRHNAEIQRQAMAQQYRAQQMAAQVPV